MANFKKAIHISRGEDKYDQNAKDWDQQRNEELKRKRKLGIKN